MRAQRKNQKKQISIARKPIQKMRKRKLRNTIFLLAFLILIGGGILFAVYKFQGNTLKDLPVSYRSENEFTQASAGKTLGRAAGFASDLCVSAQGDVGEDIAGLAEGQMAALFDLEEKEVLYAKGLYERVYPASITKLMTGILAIQSGKLDETVEIEQSDLDLEQGSQVCGFMVGDEVTLDQLLRCLLVYSGNDAASAIARVVGGSQKGFVKMMNEYAASLGMTGTHFDNPHGLHTEDHYTTPYDIYLMLREAARYPVFLEISQLSTYTFTVRHADETEGIISLASTDHYLTGEATPPKDVAVLGGKTGTTSNAGNCLALLTQNAYGKPYISIVTNASTKELLYQQMNSLLQHTND